MATSTAPPQAVAAIGAGLHFHDLRHTGNRFAAASGAGLRDPMARTGHDSARAAIIYQHEARGTEAALTNAIDSHVDAQRARGTLNDDGPHAALTPAGEWDEGSPSPEDTKAQFRIDPLAWDFSLERVTVWSG